MHKIDVHTHCFPESFLREIARVFPGVELREPSGDRPLFAMWANAPLPAWDLERRVREMDAAGIEREVLSAPTVYDRMGPETEALCQLLNDEQVSACKAAPDRLSAFIQLPLHDLSAARKELDRWIGCEHVVGVCLGTNAGGMYPGDPRMAPFWQWIDDAGLAVFVHPVKPCRCDMPIGPVLFQFPADSAIAAATMIYAGIPERHPTVPVILSHYGGALPGLARRLDIVDHPHFPPRPGAPLPRPASEYVGWLYADTAQGFHAPGFACARAVFGDSHLLYGSDHFFHDSPWRGELNSFFDEQALSDDVRAAIYRENAERVLFGRGSRHA